VFEGSVTNSEKGLQYSEHGKTGCVKYMYMFLQPTLGTLSIEDGDVRMTAEKQ